MQKRPSLQNLEPSKCWNAVSCVCQLLACFVSFQFFALNPDIAVAAGPNKSQATTDEIKELITQLGAEQYATRMEAETRLRQYGVQSLDLLRNATLSDNPQIALTARYLLRSSDIVWFFEGDSPRVRKLLRSYATDDLMDRAIKIQMLGEMHDDEGLSALARIARYESYGDLSKRAALSIMQMSEEHLSVAVVSKRWAFVNEIIGVGNNAACNWLRQQSNAYQKAIDQAADQPKFDFKLLTAHLTLQKPINGQSFEMPPYGLLKYENYSLYLQPDTIDAQWWLSEIENEQKLLVTRSGETSKELLESLCKFTAELLVRVGKHDQALEAARKLLDVPIDIREMLSTQKDRSVWAIDHGLPEFAIDVLENVQGRWASYLQYFLAEAHRWKGDTQQADDIAKKAFRGDQIGNQNIPFNERYLIAGELTDRGQYDWAQREYEAALASINAITENSIVVVLKLAPLLQDGGDYAAAAATWQPIIEKLESDPLFKQQLDTESRLQTYGLQSDTFRSTYLHLKGLAEVKNGQSELAKASFREAITLWPQNVDVAIEMFRIPGDQVWQDEVSLIIDNIAELMMDDAKSKEAEMRNSSVENLASARENYANSLNTYAWLIANVDRDLDFALQTSLLSNRLAQDKSAYIDTLARCYSAKADMDKAVYWQKRAVSLEPYQRQLVKTMLQYQELRDKLPPS